MPRLLRRLGLNFKFPERRALEQDPKALREWKRERFPQILKFAKKRKALLFYADEALVSLIPYVGRTWAFPEAKPIVRVSGRRGQHVGVTAAVNAQGRMAFELTREKERFTARVFLRFIRKLRREQPKRFIVLIVDGAPTHTANIVKAYSKENKKSFRLEILPAYSPELNPTEKSWGFLKSKNLNGSQAKDKSELRAEVAGHMKKMKKDKARVVSFFGSKN
jgi:transposase